MREEKGEYLFFTGQVRGLDTAKLLPAIVAESLEALPIPKRMRWGSGDAEFVRPVHWVVMLFGRDVVRTTILGVAAGGQTYGHRFHAPHALRVSEPARYATLLRTKGKVIADLAERRERIREGVTAAASKAGCRALLSEELLDEVAALVEWPVPIVGKFEDRFLGLPREVLIATLEEHQRCFPVEDRKGTLASRFVAVSNIASRKPEIVVHGNERVVRPRLADARFFFDTDKKTKLAERVPQLASIVYHGKLGSQLDRVERLRRLATRVQAMLPRGEKGRPYADRAALLAKADLVTLMVGEFPELQGVMGKYYAEADGEEPSVVRAIEQHYWPRFSGDQLPVGDVSIALALADKLETLVGIWGVGQQPTGDKDPFGLRRAALGVLRILSEKPEAEALDLRNLLDTAVSGFPAGKLASGTAEHVHAFMLDRLRSMLREKGYDANETEAVLADSPGRINEVWKRIEAVKAFRSLPEAEALAAANKRIQNILRKSGRSDAIDFALLQLPEEKTLHRSLTELDALVRAKFAQGDFAGSLTALATVRSDVDAFFDKVLVNAEDSRLRQSRLGILTRLGDVMNKVADISKLSS
jgi:glycyl-tRNA synthetase beta chain